jgi:hypothetical protein
MWLFATRSRPENCQRFIDAWIETNASTLVYVRVDDCDPRLDEIVKLPWPKEFTIVVGPREGLRAAMQEMFTNHPSEPWYGLLADDLLPQTPNWDLLLIDRAGSAAISYPNDLGGKPRLPTHPVVGGDLARAIGWFGFPQVHHYFVDTVWRVIGERLGCLYRLSDVIVEHVHPVWNKAETDQVYKESVRRSTNDRENFNNWVETTVPDLIKKLKEQGF